MRQKGNSKRPLPLTNNSSFTFHALPSIRDDGEGGFEHPGILFLYDVGKYGGENEWYTALNNIGLLVGEDYDLYYANGVSGGEEGSAVRPTTSYWLTTATSSTPVAQRLHLPFPMETLVVMMLAP